MVQNISDLTDRIANLGTRVETDTPRFDKWLDQEDFLQLLASQRTSDEDIILYCATGRTFVYGVLAPSRLLRPPDVKDLLQWSGNPTSSWGTSYSFGKHGTIRIEPPLSGIGSKTLSKGEQVLFLRHFEGSGEESYFEVLQKLSHPLSLHYVAERQAFCRFDKHGELEDVIRFLHVAGISELGPGRLVTIRRDEFAEYMAITKSSLVQLFDSHRAPEGLMSWDEGKLRQINKPTIPLHYRGRRSGQASYIRGFQIIHPNITARQVIEKFEKGDGDRRYASFIALDWKHKRVHECSCDPQQLGNYFVESDLPFETTPAFFRPEVLQKYKADSEKYTMEDRSISCRSAWYLRGYDVNQAGQVHAYLTDLNALPYDEQLYWKSFNEQPKAGIAERAYKSDFLAQWDESYDPLESIKATLRDTEKVANNWWSLRATDLPSKIHYPVTTSSDEWAKELHTLDKLINEGFERKWLSQKAASLGRKVEPRWGTIKLLEEILRGVEFESKHIDEVISPLRELNVLRVKLIGHASGDEAKKLRKKALGDHGTFVDHYRALCARCDETLKLLTAVLKAND